MSAGYGHCDPSQWMDSKLESFMKRIEERHEREMKKMETRLTSEKKQHERELSKMEEKHKREMNELKDEYTRKLTETLERVKKLEEEAIPQMRAISSHPVPTSIEFIMTQYSTHKKNNDAWCSPPFYTGLGGYKMCISVNANGQLHGTGTHVSVYLRLMRGVYDSRLVWPFREDITIQLVNHNNDQDDWITMNFSDTAVACGVSDRVTSGERSDRGWGYDKFISHTDVESCTKTSQYILNDCLTFRVNKLVEHSFRTSLAISSSDKVEEITKVSHPRIKPSRVWTPPSRVWTPPSRSSVWTPPSRSSVWTPPSRSRVSTKTRACTS